MGVIRTQDLKKAFERIINKLEYENIEEVKLETDWYKFIPTDEWENFGKDVIAVGSLQDDLESIALLVHNAARPCTYVDFDRVASILRAISQKNNPA